MKRYEVPLSAKRTLGLARVTLTTADMVLSALFVTVACRVAGRDVEPDIQGTASDRPDREQLDSSAIGRELGFEPAWDLDHGLDATYGWYEDYFAAETG